MQPIILLKQQAAELPPLECGESRLVVARNGVFIERRGPMYMTSTRLRPNDMQLDDHSQYCTLSCGKLTAKMHRTMLSFFLQAHRIHGGEAALVLLFHPEQRRYLWYCPVQTVDLHQRHDGWYVEDTIEFDNPLELPEGYLRLGDAHLHPEAPHPSMLDVQDDEDGLHIIVGNIAQRPQYHIAFVMDGVRFQLAPHQLFVDPHALPGCRVPAQWLEQIRVRAHRTGECG
jgi:hypothetical protein